MVSYLSKKWKWYLYRTAYLLHGAIIRVWGTQVNKTCVVYTDKIIGKNNKIINSDSTNS